MLKKIKVILICLIGLTVFIGCQNSYGKGTKLVCEELSKREEYLLNLTGNRVMIYTLKNLPEDKYYEFNLIYEVYEGSEKIKEQTIASMHNDQMSQNAKPETIALNIQEDRIKYLLGKEYGYASGHYNLEENLSDRSQAWLSNDINLNLGTEVYIFHANSGPSNITLGVPIDSTKLDKILKDNEINIFIKLSFKEI